MLISKSELAQIIDHSLLKPQATRKDIIRLCEEAMNYKFGAVCINPGYVTLAVETLKGSKVKVCTVIGFPLGATTTKVKLFEAQEAIENGAQELDLVLSIGSLKSGLYELVGEEIRSIVKLDKRLITKVILETVFLTKEEKVKASLLAKEAGANFVKTSTGFAQGSATIEDVRLLRETVGKEMGVKAAGGIRDLSTALAMIEAGANRIGTSASVAIMEEAK